MIKKRCLAVHRLVGFTLIEVLVSLSILAVTLWNAGLRAAAVAMDNNAELKERTLARWVGRNQLSRLQAGASFPGTGVTTGDAQQGRPRLPGKSTSKRRPTQISEGCQ
ncbi:MAG: type II secretion system minor pseudopilin GspI [Rhodocyclaceae bacterium]|nr:type II secretion system minor pseudopilin GspI [Rhodocyclaceae bacterium]